MFFALRRLEGGELVDVGTRDKRLLAGAGHDHDAHAGVVLQLEHGAPKFVGGRGVEGVENRRTVDRNDDDSAVALEQEVVKVHG